MKFTDQCESSEHDFYAVAELGQNLAHLSTEAQNEYLMNLICDRSGSSERNSYTTRKEGLEL